MIGTTLRSSDVIQIYHCHLFVDYIFKNLFQKFFLKLFCLIEMKYIFE